MSLKLDEMLGEVLVQESPIGDVPKLHGAVLGRARDDVVVERVPLDVKHLPAVAGDLESRGEGTSLRSLQIKMSRLHRLQSSLIWHFDVNIYMVFSYASKIYILCYTTGTCPQ